MSVDRRRRAVRPVTRSIPPRLRARVPRRRGPRPLGSRERYEIQGELEAVARHRRTGTRTFMGDRGQYQAGYRDGYKAGYDAGYSGRGPEYGEVYGRTDANRNKWDQPEDPYASRQWGASDLAYDVGYRDGVTFGPVRSRPERSAELRAEPTRTAGPITGTPTPTATAPRIRRSTAPGSREATRTDSAERASALLSTAVPMPRDRGERLTRETHHRNDCGDDAGARAAGGLRERHRASASMRRPRCSPRSWPRPTRPFPRS